MKKIIKSGLTILAIAAIAGYGTYSFFSDTETSTGNTFTAGDIDLQIDNTSYVTDANGVLVASPSTSWELKNLVPGEDHFFNFADLKPGDLGEDTISIHVGSNNAWMCAAARITDDSDQSCAEPELADDPTCVEPGLGQGELDEQINIAFWNDDGDNVYEVGETIFLDGPLSGLGLDGKITLADPTGGILGTNTPIPGDSTFYIGKAWCFGELTPVPVADDADTNPVDRENTGFTCNGADVNNAAQTDQVVGDMQFFAVQARNNPNFSCDTDYTPTWDTTPPPQPIGVGANFSDYTPPVVESCDHVINPGSPTAIQDEIDTHAPGTLLCVSDGTYDENIVMNKAGMTLAAINAPTATATINGRVRIEATGVTVKGFEILGAVVGSEGGASGVYITGGSNGVTLSDNIIDGVNQIDAQERGIHFEVGGTTGVTVTNNIIKNWDSTGLYINPTAGPLSLTFNDFLANNVAIGSSSPNNVTITNNDFVGNIAEAIGMDDTGGATSGIEIHANNLTPAGAGNNVNAYGATVVADATNNWWDGEADAARTNLPAQIDVTSPAGAAFAQN